MHRAASEGYRVLVCAPYGRDAQSVAGLLEKEGYQALVCHGPDAVASALDESIGTVVLTEEALREPSAALAEALASQPSWSDLPFVLLAAQMRGRRRPPDSVRFKLPSHATSVIVLERPLGAESLLSAIAVNMRARQRQFEMRDRLEQLTESEGRMRLATLAGNIGTWDFDPLTGRLKWDARCKALFGLPPDAAVGYDEVFLAALHPEDREGVDAAVKRALAPGSDGEFEIEYRTVGLGDGVERWIAAKGAAVFKANEAVRFLGTVIDISERKIAQIRLTESEAALREEKRALDTLARTLEQKVQERTAALQAEMANRERIEAALRQSQKMEAVGQLTGGIAHDFNNMLTGILGSIEMLRRRLASGRTDQIDRFMDAAVTSAQRAAALTARLLAFSRRQSLDPAPTAINPLVAGLHDLLARTVRENIAIKFALADGLPAGMVDAHQLESAILNLVINARDAMPEGGEIVIATQLTQLSPADGRKLIAVKVSDTGIGIRRELLERVFEPFFTTKPIGQGSGLGLSMVYGFAKQSRGDVKVESEIGRGTTVTIYLPAASAAAVRRDESHDHHSRRGSGETILVVEDDASVRLLVAEVLSELGYAPLMAAEPAHAVALLASPERIDMMVSDVGLPGVDGRRLAEIARVERPELPILFVTGYAENASIRGSFLGRNMDMIMKPFDLSLLGRKIADMLPAHADPV